ncbi:MAG: PIN domain-containing protein [Nanoarchaeota archaeon]
MKEEKVTDSKLLDSTILVDYFVYGNYREIIEGDDILLASALSLFELKRKLLEKKVPSEIVENKINFVKGRIIVLVVNNIIAEKAASLSVEHNLPAIDSIIYATALVHNAKLLTLDNDFRGLPKAVVFEKN